MFPVSLSFDARSPNNQSYRDKENFQSFLKDKRRQDSALQVYNEVEIEEKLLTLRIKLADLSLKRERLPIGAISFSSARALNSYNQLDNLDYIHSSGRKIYQDNDNKQRALSYHVAEQDKVKVLI